MLMPASPEFVALCQSQISLLIQGVGASMSAVYLTEDLSESETERTNLVPVVIYPEEAEPWPSARPQLPASVFQPEPKTRVAEQSLLQGEDLCGAGEASGLAKRSDPQQLVLPLMQDEVVLGLLVVARDQHRWSAHEQVQIQQVAETLAIACVMDQRSQWLTHTRYQQQALQADQRQTLSNLMHQFRSPLTALRTLGKLLTKRFSTDEQNRPLAESIVQQSDRLEELLQQFDGAVDIGEAALETEEWQEPPPPALLPPAAEHLSLLAMELQLQPCWVIDILSPLINSELGILDEKELHLSAHIPDELPPVIADPSALREVLSNVVDNALKYTPVGGEVRIKVRRSPSEATQVIAVSDNGPGIPRADLAHVFERHYRGVQAETEIPGTGLGLAIARTLIEQMQGQLEVFSPAIDSKESQTSGSTFLVTLPEC